MTIVLGSQSLRRKEFFHLLGLNFATDAADVDEAENHAEDPAQTVCRLSQLKARAVAARASAPARGYGRTQAEVGGVQGRSRIRSWR